MFNRYFINFLFQILSFKCVVFNACLCFLAVYPLGLINTRDKYCEKSVNTPVADGDGRRHANLLKGL